jgi:hypothetical protein
MALKQEFANQIQAQIDVWQAQIKEHHERLANAGGAATLQKNADEGAALLQQVREANESAWSDMQSATRKAFAELQKGWGEAISRFM